MSRKRKIIWAIAVLLVSAVGVLAHFFIQDRYSSDPRLREKDPPTTFPTMIYGIDENSPSLLFPINPEDDHTLLGASHNVFIGKVLAQTGNKETQIGPRTQYRVQVIDNIKGDLKNIVTVDLLGGEQNGNLVAIGGIPEEEYFLEPGTTYLLSTRYNAEEDWYTLIPHPNARKVLSSDNTLPAAALRAIADKDERVKKFESAYPDEELLEADVYHANIRNNFQSLPPDAKAAAQARAEAARAALKENAPAQP